MSDDKLKRRRFLADILFAAGGVTAAALVAHTALAKPAEKKPPEKPSASPSQTPSQCSASPAQPSELRVKGEMEAPRRVQPVVKGDSKAPRAHKQPRTVIGGDVATPEVHKKE